MSKSYLSASLYRRSLQSVSDRHPCEGQAHVIEDVGIRLVNGLHDLHLDERLGPTQEAISKGIATGSEGVWKLYSSVRTDLAKRQAEYRERREREEAAKPAPTADSLEGKLAENERPQLISDQGTSLPSLLGSGDMPADTVYDFQFWLERPRLVDELPILPPILAPSSDPA